MQCGVEANAGGGSTVTGWLYIPGHSETLTASLASGNSCADCVWQIAPACETESGVQPGAQCRGPDAMTCDPGQKLYSITLTTGSTRTVFAPVCLGGTSNLVSGEQLDLDAQRYLDRIPIPSPTLRHQPDPVALVHLPTYVEASVAAPAPETFGGPGATMTITVTPQTWHWSFGDGTGADTDHDGIPPPAQHPEDPPAAAVTHTYDTAGHYGVSASVDWRATYTVTIAGVTLGPFTVDRILTPPAATATLDVAEARAELVG